MSQSPTPMPNQWKESFHSRWGPWILIVLSLIASTCFVIGFVLVQRELNRAAAVTAAAPAPQPHTKITIERTVGGEEREKNTGTAVGGSMSGTGEQVDIDKFDAATPMVTLDGIAAISGGTLRGSLSASVEGLFWIRVVAVIFALICFGGAWWKWKVNPTSWYHIGALAVGGIVFIVIACVPTLAIWLGLGAMVVIIGPMLIPSTASMKSKGQESALKAVADGLAQLALVNPASAKVAASAIAAEATNGDQEVIESHTDESLAPIRIPRDHPGATP